MANFNIDYLVVAGGGGGTAGYGNGNGTGGGGAGGLITNVGGTSLSLNTSIPYSVTVGSGGAGGVGSGYNSPQNSNRGLNGSDSIFSGTTAIGGGGGGAIGTSYPSGAAGGSGGGGVPYSNSGGTATSGQGNNGGAGSSNPGSVNRYRGGGGGGAGSNGSSGDSSGNGGSGVTNSITVSSGAGPFYAGGGGGGVYSTGVSAGTGGLGGGGDGARNSGNGASALTNTGGGGGGAAGASNYNGGNGGSGIIILRYATADVASYTVTGAAPTEDTTTVAGQTILSFTTVGTGTITFTAPIPPFSGNKVTTPVTDFNKLNTEEGLKIPSGTTSNRPIGVEGMIRNSTADSSNGSATAITYYNGTNWRYFENELSTSFNTVLYDGTGNSVTVDAGFAPDLVWLKRRNSGDASNTLVDTVRGANSRIFSNTTSAGLGNGSFSFNSDGTFDTNNVASQSKLGAKHVAWCFKAGGLINKAAYFNGSNSYTYASSSVQQPTTDFSVSVWSKWDSKPSGSVGLVGNFRTGGGGTQPGLAIAKFNGTNVFRFYTGQNDYVSGTTNFSTNTWYHVVGTYDGSNMKIYVNGVLEGTQPYTGTPLTTTEPLVIGRMYGNYSGYYHNGLINQVRLFNNAISSQQVTELYEETAADNSVLNFPNGAGCVAAYNLGENANGVDGLYNTTASNVTFGKPGYLTRNTEGTIESTVSANNDLGFSIVSYTGNGTANQTVGNGLDLPVELLIVKRTNTTGNWLVWSRDVTSGNGKYLYLDLINGIGGPAGTPVWDSSNTTTMPTSGLFNINTNSGVNASSSTYVAYCFASKPNYSKTGSYIGNGSTTGPTVTLGFEPAWLMFKCTTQSGNWIIIDNKRATSNPRTPHLRANSNAQDDFGANEYVDFTSTGFQPKGVSNYNNNSSGQTYIYLAFANTI